ncbi:hypothetical protein VARIO8X_110082 [Burkholderiales bacterium 8X]|nr:hypothetical protein VARIO8X_110082 [Burkholderiales bacterium 8X]
MYVCMYDAAFGEYRNIFAPEIASQTYAFCFKGCDPVIALDEEVLSSVQWGEIVASTRTRFRQLTEILNSS